MQGEQPHHQQPQNHRIMDSGSRGGNHVFDGASINIVLPPKPGSSNDDSNSSSSSSNNNNSKIQGGQARMDVCALTLSCLARDPNLPSSKLPFAWKLYEMLETVQRKCVDTDIVSWVDDGTAFKVHDLKRFVEKIVPAYFKQSKYKSFQRQLYFYGFKRVGHTDKVGQTVGSYRHPRFLRGQKTLCLSMMPKKATKRTSAAKAAAAANQTQKNSKGQQETSSSRDESTSSSAVSPQQQQQQQQ
mmetsp:Transcript_13524/g.28546  ORF Transcript_13524/g.28546 Transcript_13524/m.28546 type:complete len:243 (-) Transcript_13524:245-973(-)